MGAIGWGTHACSVRLPITAAPSDSDIDLLVDVEPGVDLLDIIDAAEELEALLGRRVDIVTSRSLPAEHEISRTAVAL